MAALQRRRQLLSLAPVWTDYLIAIVSPEDDTDDVMNFVARWSFLAGARIMAEAGLAQSDDVTRRVFDQLVQDAEQDWNDNFDQE